jgi:hypothetical protein
MAAQRGGLVVVLGLLAAFAGGFVAQVAVGGRPAAAQDAQAPAAVQARAFAVVDADGRERGRLGLTDDGGVGLTLSDAEGRRRLALGSPTLADPAKVRWVLSLWDDKGTYRVLIAARDDGAGAGFGVWDANGTARFGLGAAPNGGGFSIWDAAGVERAGIGEGPTGVGISAMDDTGQRRIVMGVGPDGEPSLVASDAGGNELWRAPIAPPPQEDLP